MGLDQTSFSGLDLVPQNKRQLFYSGDQQVAEERRQVQAEKITQHGTCSHALLKE
jgi:hypothetical protein